MVDRFPRGAIRIPKRVTVPQQFPLEAAALPFSSGRVVFRTRATHRRASRVPTLSSSNPSAVSVTPLMLNVDGAGCPLKAVSSPHNLKTVARKDLRFESTPSARWALTT